MFGLVFVDPSSHVTPTAEAVMMMRVVATTNHGSRQPICKGGELSTNDRRASRTHGVRSRQPTRNTLICFMLWSFTRSPLDLN